MSDFQCSQKVKQVANTQRYTDALPVQEYSLLEDDVDVLIGHGFQELFLYHGESLQVQFDLALSFEADSIEELSHVHLRAEHHTN